MTEKHATRREHDGGEDQQRLVDAVELRHQDDSHHRNRHQHGLCQERFVLTLVFDRAAESDGDLRVDFQGRDELLEFGDDVVLEIAVGDVGFDGHRAAHVGPRNCADLLRGHAFHKGVDRDKPVRRRDAQFVELRQAAVLRRVADTNLDLVIAVIGTVLADHDAVRNQLHHRADQRDVCAEPCRFGPVDLDLPLDTRQRATILDIDDGGMLLEFGAYHCDRVFDQPGVARRELDKNRLANRRARVGLAGFYRDAGQVRGTLTHLSQDCIGAAALIPLDQVERHRADLIGRLAHITRLDVQVFDLGHAEQPLFDLPHQVVLLVNGQVATSANIDERERLFDFGEIFGSLAEGNECNIDCQQQRRDKTDIAPRRLHRAPQELHVPAGEAGDCIEVAGLRRGQVAAGGCGDGARLAEHGAQGWHDQQRHQ